MELSFSDNSSNLIGSKPSVVMITYKFGKTPCVGFYYGKLVKFNLKLIKSSSVVKATVVEIYHPKLD